MTTTPTPAPTPRHSLPDDERLDRIAQLEDALEALQNEAADPRAEVARLEPDALEAAILRGQLDRWGIPTANEHDTVYALLGRVMHMRETERAEVARYRAAREALRTVAVDLADLDELLFWSFRYALPRQSYAVGSVADLVTKYRAALSERTKARIAQEIDDACDHGAWLTEMDQRRWRQLRDVLAAGRAAPERSGRDGGG